MQRESFGSRLGFILLSAGCAIGIGNVWRFPYIVGQGGGGIFVLFYLFFLIIIGIPILTAEFAIGRASRKSAVRAYNALEKPGQKWHLHGYVAMAGNYLLMMFYTVISGWMLYYFYCFATNKFSEEMVSSTDIVFNHMLSSPGTMTFWMLIVVAAGFIICSFGLQKGVERVTKWMMIALLFIMIILAVRSFTLPGAKSGLEFYLVPDIDRASEAGIFTVISNAMNQSFFTLSLGIGAMLIFGSYLNKERALVGESINIALLDTFVAFVSGLIIFPACFAYNIEPDSGPSLIFLTLPKVFIEMPLGNLWGALFFIFMSFASISTIIAVFENIISCTIDLTGFSRRKSSVINAVLIALLSLPCVFGFNLLSSFTPLGTGTTILDLEDFIVSNLLLPIGSIVYLMFCVSRFGWGFKNFRKEANTGKGVKLPKWIRPYMTYILPVIILILFVQGIVSTVMKAIS